MGHGPFTLLLGEHELILGRVVLSGPGFSRLSSSWEQVKGEIRLLRSRAGEKVLEVTQRPLTVTRACALGIVTWDSRPPG